MLMLRKIIERNIYINDIIRRIVCANYNKAILSFVKKISQVDSIVNFDDFKEALNELPSRDKGSSYTYKCAYSENCLYGYATELMSYANLDSNKMMYLPLLEHGINFCEQVGYGYKQHVSYIFQGRSKEQSWKKERRGIPAYFIGPYIHYVRDYYDEEHINKIKSELGRTLLVFTPHSTEMGEVSLALDNFDDYLFNQIGKKYDTIIACVYWADATTAYTQKLADSGAKIVSAGFKMDPLFAQRLKSIIKIADDVLFPGITTALGYAYYCGKKVIYVDYEESIVDTGALANQKLQVYQDGLMDHRLSFAKVFHEDADIITQEKSKLINFYWGLDEIKTPEQIRDIYFNNKHRIKKRLGF